VVYTLVEFVFVTSTGKKTQSGFFDLF